MQKGFDKSVHCAEYLITDEMTDKAGRLKLSCLLYLQQLTCEEHTDIFGLPGDVIREKLGLAFVFTKLRVNVLRQPLLNEKIVVKTWCSELKGVRFTRNFRVTLQNSGELLTEGKTELTVIDLETRRLVRPANVPEFSTFLYNDTEQNGCEYPQKLSCDFCACGTFQKRITEKDIDCNRHVNNTVYADMVTEAWGEKYFASNINSFEINYLHEVLPFETVDITFSDLNGEVLACGNVGDKQSFVARLTYE